MYQTWGNGEKPSFGIDFGTFGPNLNPKRFLHKFYFYYTC